MNDASLALPVLIFSGLFLLATGSAVWLKFLRIPYTIGLVVIGMVLGLVAKNFDFLAPVLRVNLSHDLIMYVLLPVLIYDAAINIKLPKLCAELVPVLMLAVVGVVLSTFVVGGLLGYYTPVTMAGAFLFGALISATDPVAVIALFKEVGAPERMSLLMDAESLFNDATAIVMFGIVMAVVQTGQTVDAYTLLSATWEFCRVFLGGIAVGAVLSFAMLFLLRMGRGIPFVQIAHTTTLAYVSFIVADHVMGMSGVMSTITAGLITRTWAHKVLSVPVQQYLEPYWEFMAFVANSLIFLLLGLQEDLLFRDMNQLNDALSLLIIAIIVVLLARFLVVYLLIPVSNRLPKSPVVDNNTKAVMFWGGLRGVIPVALMLSIPTDMAERQIIIHMSLAVILFSLLIQGTTIGWLMEKLGIKPAEPR
ncbi:sodium:proton antiporter [Candidatus Sororendozoicomonas aggregata]|uniref:cation:proton antiporter n=1 Tax=Candidatus Sororendozoicomonas aggregata TaxID=3073239 RepID=UPI002ED32CFD